MNFFNLKVFKKAKNINNDFLNNNYPFFKQDPSLENVDISRLPYKKWEQTFKDDKNFHVASSDFYPEMQYYADIWLKLGCPYYTEDDLYDYFGGDIDNSNFLTLNTIRELFIATPPRIYYNDNVDMYSVSDGRHRLIALVNASLNNGIPIRLRVHNGLYDKYCNENGIVPFDRDTMFLEEMNNMEKSRTK